MPTNTQVAQQLEEIADMLDLLGEKFKPDAYRRAARSIEALGEDLRRIRSRGGLGEIPGVGEAIAAKIEEFLSGGKIEYLEKLRRQFPPGILDLMQLPGIGPKTARRFWVELGVEGPAELAQAIDSGKLAGVRGFGEKKIAQLRQAVTPSAGVGKRMPLRQAFLLAAEIVRGIQAATRGVECLPAGSLRRSRESQGDLDIVATSPAPPAVFEAFAALPGVLKVVLRGETKMTVIHAPGIQVDLRVVEPEAYGAALQYFTGSKDHNIHLRTIARDRGLKVNEYGVWKEERRIAGATEEEVYHALDLPVMPAEIRENRGEIEAAQSNRLPTLVDARALHGELHLHLSKSPDRAEVDRWVDAAGRAGYHYIGLVLPEGGEKLPADGWGYREVGGRPPGGQLLVRFGLEGRRPEDAARTRTMGADFFILGGEENDPPRLEKFSPVPMMVGHLRLGEEGEEADAERAGLWVKAVREAGVALEVTPFGAAQGLDSGGVRQAADAGVPIVVSSGATLPEEMAGVAIAVGLARRGWLSPRMALNAREHFPMPEPPARRPSRSA
jgi:DNA polymerase (family X)